MAPAPGEQPKSSPSPSPRRAGSCFGRALKVFLLLGVVLTGAGSYGAWWMWRYVQNDLAPLVKPPWATSYNVLSSWVNWGP